MVRTATSLLGPGSCLSRNLRALALDSKRPYGARPTPNQTGAAWFYIRVALRRAT
jgi:hypothetical protein